MRNSKKMFDTKAFQRYGIRTFGQGAASVMIASGLFFLSGGSASASDVQGEEINNVKIEKPEPSPSEIENIQEAVKEEVAATTPENVSLETSNKVEGLEAAKETSKEAKSDETQKIAEKVAEEINTKLEAQKEAEKTSQGADEKVETEKETAEVSKEVQPKEVKKETEVTSKKKEEVVTDAKDTEKLSAALLELEVGIRNAEVTTNTKSALEDAKKALEEANNILNDKNSTQEDIDRAVATVRNYRYVVASMPKEGSQKVTRTRRESNLSSSTRSGESGFRNTDASNGIGHDVTDSTTTPKVEKPGFTPELLARQLKEQINWVDFGDATAWTGLDTYNGRPVLKEGAVYTKNLTDDYKVTIKIKSLKPFQATDIFKNRVEAAGENAKEAGYDPNAKNTFISGRDGGKQRYINREDSKIYADQQSDRWSELSLQGVSTGDKKTVLLADDGSNVGIQFEISATYKEHVVKPAIVMADGESANPGELILFTTNRGGWTHVGEWRSRWGQTENYVPQDVEAYLTAYRNGNSTPINGITVSRNDSNIRQLSSSTDENIQWKYFSNNDKVTGGLGTGVFGPVVTASNNGARHGVPVVMTEGATEIGMYIVSGGQQSAMIGFFPLDESDAPESYGVAKHAISQKDGVTGQTVPQPYLGKNRPDMDEKLDRANKPWKADDATDGDDEGINQILPAGLTDKTNDIIKMDRTKEGNYTLTVHANKDGAQNVWVKGWIDFNQNGVFDENEGSELTRVTQDGDVTMHFNNGPAMDDLSVKELGIRVRISKHDTGEDILKPTGFALSGEVEDFKTQITFPPKGEKEETTGYKGFTQKSSINFIPQGNHEYNLSEDTKIDVTVAPIMIDNKTKAAVSASQLDSDGYYHVVGQGKYKITSTGASVDVEFVPEPNFVGKADGISIRRQDNNKYTTEWHSKDTTKPVVNNVLNTMDGLYIPTVIETTKVEERKSVQGAVQSSTTVEPITYTNAPTKTTLLDGMGKDLGTTTPAMSGGKQVGTYSVDNNGQVTFTPNKDFHGKVDPIVVQATDSNGTNTTVTYTPEVVPVTPTADNATSSGIQGATQEKEVTFTPGSAEINNKTETVALDPTKFTLLNDNNEEATEVPAKDATGKVVGTYTLKKDATGAIVLENGNPMAVFTPKDKTFTGAVLPVTIQGKDTNGTPATATYTPTIVPVNPNKENSNTEDVQGVVQKSEIVFDNNDTDGKTLNFAKGTGTVDNTEKSVELDTTTLTLVGAGDIQPVDGKVTIPGQGEYTIIDENGKKYVQFTPEKSFVGSATPVTVQVKDANGTAVTATYTPKTVGVKPTATAATSKDIQGVDQSGTVTFTAGKATIGTEEKNVPIKANSAVLLGANNQPATGTIDALDPQGNKVGEYTIDPATNKVTFKPTNKAYTGLVQPAKVRAEDENGTPVETTYTPEITPIEPISTNATSTGIQGATQTGTPTIKEGDSRVPMNNDEFKLLDKDGNEVTGNTTPAYSKDGSKEVGTYTYDKATGTVTFTPKDKTFTGELTPATIQGKDNNGTVKTATYTPTIVPATPTADNATSTDIQGATQEKEVTFTAGTGNVNGTDVTVALDPTKFTLLNENNEEATEVPAKDATGKIVGTYTLKKDDSGAIVLENGKPVAVFTPTDKTFTGAVLPVTIQGKDTNGTKATATYTPTIVPVTPKADPASTTGVQGAVQKAEVVFDNKATDDDKKTLNFDKGTGKVDDTTTKAVELKKDTLKLVKAGTATANPDGSVTVEGQGTYSIVEEGGKKYVQFTPVKSYTGEVTPVTVQIQDENGTPVETTYTPSIVSVKPVADNSATTGKQGEVQISNISYDAPNNTDNDDKTLNFAKGTTTIEGAEASVALNKKSVALVKADNGTLNEDGTLTVAGQGTYSLVKNDEGEVTGVKFTPLASYTGAVNPVTVKIADENGTEIETTYAPAITPVTADAKPATSTGIQGATQTGTPEYKAPELGEGVTATPKYSLEGANPEGKVVVENVGTYSVDENGVVTFVPVAGYTGTPTEGVKVKVDYTLKAGEGNETVISAETTYTPTVTAVTATGENKTSTGIQGDEQKGTPTFTVSDATNIQKQDEKPKAVYSLENANEEGKVVVKEGDKVLYTYSVDKDSGEVTFTPASDYKGQPQPATVKATFTLETADTTDNTTAEITATATYTPSIVPVTPKAAPAETKGIQGAEQTSTISYDAENNTDNDAKTLNFAKGTETVNNEEKSKDLDKKSVKLLGAGDGANAVQPSADGTVEVPNQGKYELVKDPDGTVTGVKFTPVKTFTGKATPVKVQILDVNGTPVETTFTPEVVGVTPTATPATSKDIQGATQEKEVTFTPGKTSIDGTDVSVELDTTKFTLLGEDKKPATEVPAKDPAGKEVGKYTLKVENGKPTVVFTPTNKSYTGTVSPVTIQGEDTNGTPITTTYTPEIVKVTPTATPATSTGIQGATQEGTPTFTGGEVAVDGTKKTVAIDTAAPAKLINPTTGTPTDETSIKVDGEGTYTIDPTTGKVTFTPEKTFTGPAKGIDVQRVDTNGTPATAKYTPTVIAASPKGADVVTEDIQGAVQKAKPVFTPGKAKVDEQDKEVPLDDKVPAKLVDSEGKDLPLTDGKYVVPNEGTYEVAPDGTVTFTPEKTFTGKGTGVTVQRVDTNGTPATAKYTPVVKPAQPSSKPAITTGIQGQVQTGQPTFITGKTTVDGGEKEVPLDNKVPAVIVDSEGNPVKLTDGKYVVPNEGTYEVAPDGTVTFTPDKSYSGQATGVTVKRVDNNGTPVTASYTPVVIPVSPNAEDVTSTDVQGEVQTGKPRFTPGTTTLNKNKVTVEIDETVAPVIVDSEGNPVTLTEGKYVVPNEGTYEIAPDGTVTFTPEKTFTGQAKGVTVKRVDKNGTPATATYKPTVTPVTPTATPADSTGIQGAEQSGTPSFAPGKGTGDKGEKTVPLKENSYKLLDKDGNVVTTNTIPAYSEDGSKEVGTYTIDPKTGKVTFTPKDKTYTGKVTPVTVQGEDVNGTKAKTTYTPSIVPVAPMADKAETTGKQGEVQISNISYDAENNTDNDNTTLNFTKGTETVNNKEESVALNKKSVTLVKADNGIVNTDGSITVANQGKYELVKDTDGNVTGVKFSPLASHTGPVNPVTVRILDENGTPVETTYTPSVEAVSAKAEGTTSTGIQGSTQTGTPTYTTPETGKDVTVTPKYTLKGANPDGKVVVENVGTYSVDKDGVVTFVPVAGYTGTPEGVTVEVVYALTAVDGSTTDLEKVEAKYVPTVNEVTAEGKGKATTNIQGQTQKETLEFSISDDTNIVKDENNKPKATYSLEGANSEGKVVVAGVGTYSVDSTTGEVTFEPEKTYVTTPKTPAHTVTVKATYVLETADKDDTTTKEITATAKYTPTVTKVTPTSTPADSTGVQGTVQEGTPKFKEGDSRVPLKENSYKLLDKDGNEVPEGQTTPAYGKDGKEIGTYSIDKATGKVTFTPKDKTYIGEVTPATVQGEDVNGTKVPATYTPKITPVKPTSTPAESTGVQGTTQEGTPTFKEGDRKVPLKENSYKLLDKDGKEVPEGQTIPAYGKDGKEIGTYSIDKATGKVTFTPTDKTYTDEVTPATVQGEDENGTKAKTTYTPHIVKVTPKGVDVPTEDAKGKTQSATPVFEGGKVTINEKVEIVAIDTTVPAKFIDPTTGQPTNETTITVKGEGTYVLNPTTGTITFTPEPNYAGTATGITIERVDTNGTPARATYTPTVRPETKFVDKDGNPIPGTTTEDGKVDPKTIKGYKRTGTKISPNGDIEYIYEKVTTSYLDENGNPIPTHPTEDGELPKADIPGYEFVETKVLPNGDTQHIYRKATPVNPTPQTNATTSYLDENGNPILPIERGEKGEKDIPGYEYVRTIVDENGNIRHIYRKVVATVKEKQLPNTSANNTASNNANAAGLGLIGMVAVAIAARRRRKDK